MVYANTLFSEQELRGFQKKYDVQPNSNESEAMQALRQEMHDYLEEIAKRVETKIHIIPEISFFHDGKEFKADQKADQVDATSSQPILI